MNVKQRLTVYHFSLTPETQFCINCEHYYQHYQRDGKPFNSGHCCYPRLKFRRDYDTCEYFEKRKDKCSGQ